MFRRDEIPIYERGGMRFDLAKSDPERRGGHKNEYRDNYTPEPGREQVYHFGVMFPDEFNPMGEDFLISQFKNHDKFDHSPCVSLHVIGEQWYWKFRPVDKLKGPDDRIRRVCYTDIIRNKWYDFTVTAVWHKAQKNHSGAPRFKCEVNGHTIIEDVNVPNMYELAECGPAIHIGPYIWEWGNQVTQTVYMRL